MSELTMCNYCSYQSSLRRAKKENKKVTILPDDFGMGGVSEFIHPKDVKIKTLTKQEREQYRGGWFMELTDHCVC